MGCLHSKTADDDYSANNPKGLREGRGGYTVASHDTDAWGAPVQLRSSIKQSGPPTPKAGGEKPGASNLKLETGSGPSKRNTEVGAATINSASVRPAPKIFIDNAPLETKREGFVPKVKPHSRSSKSGILYQQTPYSKKHDTIPAVHELDMDVKVLHKGPPSDQYLPANGSRLVRVPAGNFELHYSVLTQRGYYPEALDKANQDSFTIHTAFGDDPNDHLFGVFDGHGEFGEHCSEFSRKHLPKNFLNDPHFRTDVVQAHHSAYLATNSQLHKYNQIDDSMSGTTGITVLVRGRKIYVANVGDSRAVVAVRKGKKLLAKDLSYDQTPYRADECARVKQCGARVMTLDQLEGAKDPNVQCWGGEGHDDGDPPRLWVANGMYPGTAFTRSLGDTVAEQIGVTAVPEVFVMELRRRHPFFVIASDGVFEFLSSQAVVDMAAKYKDPKDACAAIVAESYRLWLQYETRTDDITIIVVHVDGLREVKTDRPEPIEAEAQSMQIVPYDATPAKRGEEPGKKARPVRTLSRARLRAIEASTGHEAPWVPSDPHLKTPGEEAQIQQAMHGNFLFQSLTENQRRTLCECMKRLDVRSQDIIIQQGAEDAHFYIVEGGEFEVLVSQNGADCGKDLGAAVLRYDADTSPCFGELALMYFFPPSTVYNKPGQATVRAVTDGSLWVLEREAFRRVLLMRFTNRPSLKFLHSLEILSKLSLSQLHCLADTLSKVTFSDGESIAVKAVQVEKFHVVYKGQVLVNYHDESKGNNCRESPLQRSRSGSSKKGTSTREETPPNSTHEVRCFGEWVLLDLPPRVMTAVAVGDVECWVVSREGFETALGPLSVISKEEERQRGKMSTMRKKQLIDVRAFRKITFKDLDWQATVYSTDCCEVGLVLCKDSGDVVSMKRYQRKKVQSLSREGQVLLERFILRRLQPSPFVPHLLASLMDSDSAALVLNCVLAGPLALLLSSPLNEASARYMAASLVLAIELLQKDGVAYRGISPDILMIDSKGRLQLVDFRFAAEMSSERNFTICGMADFLAPEIIRGHGHSLAADWWAVGVLLYFMVQGELPFGSWRDNELDIFGRIACRQLVFPATLSAKVVDLLDKLLVVDESKRLGCGSQGVNEIKGHPWFKGIDWDALLECRVEVPPQIVSRLQDAVYLYKDDKNSIKKSPFQGDNEKPWLEGW